MSFDEKLKSLRRQNNMTQDDVANYLNVARSTIAGYETKNRQPSHEKLTALADLFQVSVDYLINDEAQITLNPANDKNEQALLTLYRGLSTRSKKELLSQGHLLELRDKEEQVSSTQ